MRSRLNADRLEAIAKYCEQQVSERQFAGMAWQINTREQSSGTRVHGYSDHKLERLLQPDSIYRLYSMTKPMISVLCLMLVEKGLLRLGDPVSRWIPAFASQQVLGAGGKMEPLHRSVSVEDLLTHRAGLSYDFLPDCAVAREYRHRGLVDDASLSLVDLVAALAELPLAHQPGERWCYSYATDVLAHLLECVTDKPLRSLLRETLLTPLGLFETDFQVRQADQSRLAEMFGQRSLSQVQDPASSANQLNAMSVEESYPSNRGDTFARGGIGLFSTIDDYLLFMQLMQSGKSSSGESLISSAMLDFMWRNRLTSEQMPICIGQSAYPGYGWNLVGRVMCDTSQAMQLTSEGEGGWAGAASTYFWVDRRREFSGVVMVQYLGSAISVGPDIQAMGYAALMDGSAA